MTKASTVIRKSIRCVPVGFSDRGVQLAVGNQHWTPFHLRILTIQTKDKTLSLQKNEYLVRLTVALP